MRIDQIFWGDLSVLFVDFLQKNFIMLDVVLKHNQLELILQDMDWILWTRKKKRNQRITQGWGLGYELGKNNKILYKAS